MSALAGVIATAAVATLPTPAAAWGAQGHEIIAALARSYLSPQARRRVDAMLAQDPDPSTGRGMLAASNWADAERQRRRETSAWHYVDLELVGADLRSACHGFRQSFGPASTGPARDCIVNKIEEFQAELARPDTPTLERILALKFLLHFIADLHQPLHAADNHDHGGNCVQVSLGPFRTTNLHHYWDSIVVEHLGDDPERAAGRLRKNISAQQVRRWNQGSARDWAMETYDVAARVTYGIPTRPGCKDQGPVEISRAYAAEAERAADLQLEKAGVRLARVLNDALGPVGR